MREFIDRLAEPLTWSGYSHIYFYFSFCVCYLARAAFCYFFLLFSFLLQTQTRKYKYSFLFPLCRKYKREETIIWWTFAKRKGNDRQWFVCITAQEQILYFTVMWYNAIHLQNNNKKKKHFVRFYNKFKLNFLSFLLVDSFFFFILAFHSFSFWLTILLLFCTFNRSTKVSLHCLPSTLLRLNGFLCVCNNGEH